MEKENKILESKLEELIKLSDTFNGQVMQVREIRRSFDCKEESNDGKRDEIIESPITYIQKLDIIIDRYKGLLLNMEYEIIRLSNIV